jgi:hypothetical protein
MDRLYKIAAAVALRLPTAARPSPFTRETVSSTCASTPRLRHPVALRHRTDRRCGEPGRVLTVTRHRQSTAQARHPDRLPGHG